MTPILSPFLEFINQNHSSRNLSRFWGCPHFIRTWSQKICPGFQNGDNFFRSDSDIRKSNVRKDYERNINDQDFTPLTYHRTVQTFYRVFPIDLHHFEDLGGQQKTYFRLNMMRVSVYSWDVCIIVNPKIWNVW